MTVNVSVHSNSGVINVLSHLNDVVQTVGDSRSISPSKKEEWAALIERLKQELKAVPADRRDDAEAVVEAAAAIAKELHKDTPRPKVLRITASGLIEAAKALSEVVPMAIETAKKIALFVASPL